MSEGAGEWVQLCNGFLLPNVLLHHCLVVMVEAWYSGQWSPNGTVPTLKVIQRPHLSFIRAVFSCTHIPLNHHPALRASDYVKHSLYPILENGLLFLRNVHNYVHKINIPNHLQPIKVPKTQRLTAWSGCLPWSS